MRPNGDCGHNRAELSLERRDLAEFDCDAVELRSSVGLIRLSKARFGWFGITLVSRKSLVGQEEFQLDRQSAISWAHPNATVAC